MPIQSIEPRRLYRQIADQIRSLVRSGEYTPGQRLPPERDLARQLGVSRPSVREALIALEVEGLVEVRIGSGIYVLGGGNGHDREVQAASGPFELLRARWIIEGECAARAARSA
jgi:DNA-binding FadR family transcriptional regulator